MCSTLLAIQPLAGIKKSGTSDATLHSMTSMAETNKAAIRQVQSKSEQLQRLAKIINCSGEKLSAVVNPRLPI